MSYSEFTIETLEERFGVEVVEDCDLFSDSTPVEIPELLTQVLQRFVPLAITISTEKARSELIIAPILAEFKLRFKDKLSLFSGIDFTVDQDKGLNGRCDYILSRSGTQLMLGAPILVIVKAKNENIIGGIPQCIAEMIAAHLFNERKHNPMEAVYGVVTTGSLWRFLKLTDNTAYVDRVEYPLQQLDKIVGILTEVISR
uniref:Type I restriction enzyme R protein N terminus (HSDR_N) n=1 Tax=Candidatus Kentrum eta TaxID=2126337 RepID=A0A450U7J4_9GAMM|nr:MAG: hypothetical protein BECKH772A_GA0070896_100052 [Candidatus Kentron sp. H]VFJ89499.1 MAG: hypothetical protein BECKH772B_GA0070898_100052 [Candidatus Kentron sp. H]VFJ96147.1 MAG: hypothetical protein BECKH772C_GA0070978_100052 [Candidatus Kentron sp. H]